MLRDQFASKTMQHKECLDSIENLVHHPKVKLSSKSKSRRHHPVVIELSSEVDLSRNEAASSGEQIPEGKGRKKSILRSSQQSLKNVNAVVKYDYSVQDEESNIFTIDEPALTNVLIRSNASQPSRSRALQIMQTSQAQSNKSMPKSRGRTPKS